MRLPAKFYRYGLQASTQDLVKFLAMTSMVLDHLGAYVFVDQLWLRALGRMAAPLFFFLVGFERHYQFRFNLIIYGLGLTLLNYLLEHHLYLNILLNFVLIKALLGQVETDQWQTQHLITVFVGLSCALVVTAPWFEYGTLGLLFALGGQLLAQKDHRGYSWIGATLLIYFCWEILNFNFLTSAVIFLFMAVCLILAFILFFYQYKIWPLSFYLRYPILLIGRYTLPIYVGHLVLLRLFTLEF